ncbi:MAG: hypothetical protein HYR72_15320 [Deltaproteobacteria bacterium]|nr:hypothetical protein [Deltaproteobacteria bacterium]MBI3390171.1 hypothetical protein [Deltaproteobacteria bacterium]
MSPLEIALIVFACVFGAAMLGLFIGNALPDHHLSPDTKDVVKLATALIATMAALVLSLLISSAKSSFDKMSEELLQNAARVVTFDRALADYGAETRELRDLLKHAYAARIELLFPVDTSRAATLDSPEQNVRAEGLRTKLWELSPQTEAQRELRSQAVEIANEMLSTRWLQLLQNEKSVPVTLLVVLVSWLAIIFATFGLFAPRNATVVAALLVCALSVAGAILLIIEMDSPFSGLMRVSSAPMRDALAHLGK